MLLRLLPPSLNVGFAALQMNNDLGFSATMFGWAGGRCWRNLATELMGVLATTPAAQSNRPADAGLIDDLVRRHRILPIRVCSTALAISA